MASRISDDERIDVLFYYRRGDGATYISSVLGMNVNRVRYIINTYRNKTPWYIKLLNKIGAYYD